MNEKNPEIAIFTDFDDTFFMTGEPEKTEQNVQALRKLQAAGGIIVLASGRSLSSLERNCPEFIPCFDYLILDNGAICLEVSETELTELFSFTISLEFCTKILEFLKAHFSESEFAGIFYYDSYEHERPEKSMTKIRFWFKDAELTAQAARLLIENFETKLYVFFAKNKKSTGIPWISAEYNSFVDLAVVEAGKEQAIEKLVAMKFPKARIVVVGDGSNDIGMLEKFDGFAVGNAEPETKAIVKSEHVVESVAKLVDKILAGEI